MKVTPMMKQFLDIKNKYSDCILLFRAGDFYETFYEDAKTVSKVLNITLTKRGGVDMAGVPYHSITPYIKKLIQNNYKVAICEQLEDPKNAKGVVKRGVTRVITPGTIIEEDFLENFENNYIMSIYLPKDLSEKIGISLTDISTGEFFASEIYKYEDLRSAIKKFNPREIIMNEKSLYKNKIINFLNNQNIYFNFLSEIRYNIVYSNEVIKKQFNKDLKDFGINSKYIKLSVGALLFYIHKLQKLDLSHLNEIKEIKLNNNLILDEVTLRNLEVVESLFLKDKSKTLFGILNNTKTPMGARLLKKNLIMPFLDINKINKRLDAIEELKNKDLEREEIRNLLEDVCDIERISTRISSEVITPKELRKLIDTIKKFDEINKILDHLENPLFLNLKLKKFDEVVDLIENSIVEEAPSNIRDFGYIKEDFNEKLKELYEISKNSKNIILEIEEKERINTGINNLKIKFNKVFGYYIEIPKSQASRVPGYYVRKQTLVNAERFTISELKEKEDLILNSEEKIKILEKEIYINIVKKLKRYVSEFKIVSKKIALLDIINNNSHNAVVYDYCKPKFTKNKEQFIIKEGRNPIVERFVNEYIPNDVVFSSEDVVKIVTGPNMSGKSTFLRQVGLIIIMAQSGSFVPCSYIELPIFDRIFTRIGAHDELSEGQSTFMVEMAETANILNNITQNSLVLLDEIGRGTSTYDGVAIAWSVAEYLIKNNIKTIFATHYHYLNELEKFYNNVKNYHTEVEEIGYNENNENKFKNNKNNVDGKIKFLRKIVRGGTDKSYGVYVAKIAGLPNEVIDRAVEIQDNIENKEEIKISYKNLSFKKGPKLKDDYNNKKLKEFF